jgi:hypothetical protein
MPAHTSSSGAPGQAPSEALTPCSPLSTRPQVQQYPKDPFHPHLPDCHARLLAQYEDLDRECSSHTLAVHLSSLDIVRSLRQQLLLLDAAAATSAVSGRAISDGVLRVLDVLHLLFASFPEACCNPEQHQDCCRAVMQVLASPDMLTTLIRLAMSPNQALGPGPASSATSAAAPGGTLAQASGSAVARLQGILVGFEDAARAVYITASSNDSRLWGELREKVSCILGSHDNSPFLEALVLSTAPDSSAPSCLLSGCIFAVHKCDAVFGKTLCHSVSRTAWCHAAWAVTGPTFLLPSVAGRSSPIVHVPLQRWSQVAAVNSRARLPHDLFAT